MYDSKENLDRWQSLMQFYYDDVVAKKLPEIRRKAISMNPNVDSDLVAASVDGMIKRMTVTMAERTNNVCLLLVDLMMSGAFDELARFEVLLADLIERTLLKRQSIDKFISELEKKISETEGRA